MQKLVLSLSAVLFAAPALALEPLDGSTGFSGFVNLGVGAGQVESNFLAEIGGFGIDLGDEGLDNLGSPDSEDIFIPVAAVGIGYTFSNGKTRVTLGNDISDQVNWDRSSEIAVRHDFDGYGIVEGAFFNAAALETRVWEDPYQLTGNRDDTELAVSGARIVWSNIWDTGIEFRASTRERDLDEELSGASLGLPAAERDLLDRNGDIIAAELSYHMQLEEQHSIRPSVRYIDRDLDGDAMAQDGVEIGLAHRFTSNEMIWNTKITYAALDGDEENPIFLEYNDVDRVTFSSSLMLPGLFGWDNWVPNVAVFWGDEDSDIDFNDSTTWIISAAVMRRF